MGPRLVVDGEADFKKAITGINKDMNVLASEMKLVTSAFGDNKNSIEALTSKSEVYNKQIVDQKEKVKLMTDALQNAKTEYGENSNKVKDWQIQLNNAESVLAKTESALKQNETAIKGFDQAQSNAILHSKEFTGVQDGLTNACKKLAIGVAAAVVGLGAMIMKSVESADTIQVAADVYGLTAERVQELTYVGTKLDVSLETQLKSQQMLTKAMYAAKEGTGAQSDAFVALGVTVVDANGNMRDAKDVMTEAFTALGLMTNETERDALAQKVFGKSAMELNPLIKANADEIANLTKEAHTSGAVVSNETIAALDNFGDSTEALKLSLQGATATALTPLIPKLQDMADKLKNIDTKPLTDALAWVMDNGQTIVVAIASVAGVLVTYKVAVIAGTAVQEIHNAILVASALAHGGLSAATGVLATATGGKTAAILIASTSILSHNIALAASAIAHGVTSAATGIATAAQWAFNAAMTANPIGVVIGALALLGVAIYEVVKHWEDICEWIEKAWNWLTTWNGTPAEDKYSTVTTEHADSYTSSYAGGNGAGRGDAYANGTSNATAGLHWVGEYGPELLNFRGGESVLNARDSAKAAGTTINFNGSYSFSGQKDIDYFMNQAAVLVQRRQG